MFATSRTWWKRTCGWMTIAACAVSGCNRFQYRQAADQEVACLVQEKSYDPRWTQDRWAEEPGFTVDMDPRSRFYEPYVQEQPPMPPDDPDSHQYMHLIYGKKGWKHWHDNGDRLELENPGWRESLSTYTRPGKDGKIRMGLDDAVRIGLVNSSTYQTQIETLYLSALDVSTERFRFDVQFYGGFPVGNAGGFPGNFQHLGAQRAGGEANSFTAGSAFQMRKHTATAADFLVGFANSFVWQFTGQNTDNTTTLLNFSLVQPLLRAGGRVVGLEQLTIAERTLLGNLRAFQQYRQGWYTLTAIGDLGGIQGPQRRGGFLGGSGLTGFTGQGSSGFGGVGDATGLGGAGAVGGGGAGGAIGGQGVAGGGAGAVSGFLGLLQQLQQIRNTENTLNLELRTLALLEANLDAGLIDIAQVDLFRQNILTERSNLLQNQNNLQTTLDNFKLASLGTPQNLEIELDDSLIEPFQLIDLRLSDMQNELSDFARRFGELPKEPSLEALTENFEGLASRLRIIGQLFELVEEDLKQLDVKSRDRVSRMSPVEKQAFLKDRERLTESLGELRERFDKINSEFVKLKTDVKPDDRAKIADQFVAQLVDLENVLGELTLVQARARLEAVSVKSIDLEAAEALEIARSNRLDWMNKRASLVDTWRLIEFNANALLSNFNITFDGDLSTLGNNPVAFRAPTGRLRAGFQIDPPLTRLIERNNFRGQLISYQQARRTLVLFEDNVYQNMREWLRRLNYLKVNLEIQRRAVTIAVRRVDQTRETLAKPIPPGLPGAAPSQFGPTASINLLNALSDLRGAQNAFMSVYLNYEAYRMRLVRELGVMQIDDHGLWIDEPFDVIKHRVCPDLYPLPPDVHPSWLQEVPPEPVPPLPEPPAPSPAKPPAAAIN